MSTVGSTAQKMATAQAVEEEYEKLQRIHIDGRRIVFIDDELAPEGGFGIVRRAELHQSAYLPTWLASRQYGPPQLVAVKQIKVSKISNVPRVKRAFTREMLVWSSLEAHPGIAKFLGFYADFKRSEAWLLSPWEPNGNVSEFIKAHNLEVPEKLSLVYDTIDALAFLHQLNPPVCHGDIKSANVLVTAEYKARLCDFGLARLHEDSGFGRLETSTGMKGSVRWCSPEVLNGAPREPASDVYSWAWLVWEIMTGMLPYEDATVDFVIMRQIFESPLPQVDGQSRLSDCLQLWELMTRCWNFDPLRRPTAAMCKPTVTYLPRCTPISANAKHQTAAALLENLGDLESWKGNIEKSSAYLNEALRLYEEDADAKGVASVLRKQAAAAYRITDSAKLRTVATTALQHCRTLQDAAGIAEASYYLGFAIERQGEADEALPLLHESLEIRRTQGDDVGVVQCLERIGEIQRYQGQLHEALSTVGEAVEIASRSGDRLGRALVLHVLGNTYADLLEFVKADEALSEGITITRSIGWGGGLSTILYSMGQLKLRLGDYGEAEEILQESISVARHARDRLRLAQALDTMGDCLQRQSKLNEAVPVMEEACLLWREVSWLWNGRIVASNLVQLKSSQGDWDGVLYWRDYIIAVCRIQEDHWQVANNLEQKGDVLLTMQRYDDAVLHFEAAMVTRLENSYSWSSELYRLCNIPKVAMAWGRPLLCDLKKLQRRLPQLVTATLKISLPNGHGRL